MFNTSSELNIKKNSETSFLSPDCPQFKYLLSSIPILRGQSRDMLWGRLIALDSLSTLYLIREEAAVQIRIPEPCRLMPWSQGDLGCFWFRFLVLYDTEVLHSCLSSLRTPTPPPQSPPGQLALRAGRRRKEKQDTVGCCSLRVEHINLHRSWMVRGTWWSLTSWERTQSDTITKSPWRSWVSSLWPELPGLLLLSFLV